ncbi:alpha-galactosidase [Phaeobacter porticola]|uniref:alpha-galactosidase n=1 Tax=Phaeobacter porticola TaxID=1844006 RepID=A0A1L3I6R6_9RHOB|nr:alpha-galactosidase [Phaeobacter porticola]APG47838.1 Alpha-galactosidase [Phaeobacter porticola]
MTSRKQDDIRSWALQDQRQSLILAARGNQLAEVIYWGPRLPDGTDLTALAAATCMDVTGGMLDAVPPLSICPEARRTFPGQPGLSIVDTDGAPILPRFAFLRAEEGNNAITLRYRDEDIGISYGATFELTPSTGIIRMQASLQSDNPIHLPWLSAPVLPAPQNSDDIIDFHGRWIGEFQISRTPWSAGARLRDNPTGRTSHEHFPGLIVPCNGATNTQGVAYAFHYGWSGGHRMLAEELPDGRRQIQFGHASGSRRALGTCFETAPLYVAFSDQGMNGCAVAFQRHLRDEILEAPRPDRPRPVHYNCWEAVYFGHEHDTLCDIASRAADLGAERFVLDDGWFGKRDDDTTSLGDWTIDERKYPDGLMPLIEHVHAEGMTFGIWFEPEMVNPESDLFRAHPDWMLGDRDQILGRQQLVLNIAMPEVRDYLYERIAAMLAHHPIDYVKWDHNRVLPEPDCAQAKAAYALFDRLRAGFPEVEFESCSSGGGRIDFGILSRTHRVWLSDSNDPIERLRIQHEAALFLPMVVTGSHVGPRQCHTSGRATDIRLRAWVAAQRHMGFEMDPRELTEEETKVLQHVTSWWKDNRNWMARADILRLDSDDPAVIAELQRAEGGRQFVVFAGLVAPSTQILPRPLRLTGLEPDASYLITLHNRDDTPALSRGTPLLKTEAVTLSGQYLMHYGITLPWSFPQSIWVIEGTRQ